MTNTGEFDRVRRRTNLKTFAFINYYRPERTDALTASSTTAKKTREIPFSTIINQEPSEIKPQTTTWGRKVDLLNETV